MSRWIEPVTLSGQHVKLVPMSVEHEQALAAAAADGELWKLWYTSVPEPDKTRAWIDAALAMRDTLGAHPFAVIDAKTGDVVGSTRYFNVDEANRRLEIGHTWYAKRVQRTALNTEAKLLLLTHAFEKLNAIAVEFRTHFMNHQSRAAIARLGAKQDGILRNHQVGKDGAYRDTVVFSIIQSEWPAVRIHLKHRLEG
ncbi:GCN5-related N-acetyltransferase [Caballeronia arationis]|jgi:RimJ/RimL family protein N-acetyltransferase|uniref:Protein N-acetyltransferase, RimJ/RimL family n=1 Tax=Caballeronia arationis TaxID=1777142 RepID=A0A7Z7IBN9_9BURK|nr:GNAT family protein [Caballeronia arationis]SAK70646.1 GCN5-related N-acetyltransferase [Caballeronia arationis]SOE82205.1 Protein N-acetyltransferase, RimJ/RimL family [Caballeronia arationis]